MLLALAVVAATVAVAAPAYGAGSRHVFTAKQVVSARFVAAARMRQTLGAAPTAVRCFGYLRVVGGWLEIRCTGRARGVDLTVRWFYGPAGKPIETVVVGR